METFRLEIELTQKDLTILQTHPEFVELDGRLSKKLDKTEKAVISNKKGKMTRDQTDYENDKVYTSKKSSFLPGRSRKNHGKLVSFSDPENDLIDDTLAITGSDSSPEPVRRSSGLN